MALYELMRTSQKWKSLGTLTVNKASFTPSQREQNRVLTTKKMLHGLKLRAHTCPAEDRVISPTPDLAVRSPSAPLPSQPSREVKLDNAVSFGVVQGPNGEPESPRTPRLAEAFLKL